MQRFVSKNIEFNDSDKTKIFRTDASLLLNKLYVVIFDRRLEYLWIEFQIVVHFRDCMAI